MKEEWQRNKMIYLCSNSSVAICHQEGKNLVLKVWMKENSWIRIACSKKYFVLKRQRCLQTGAYALGIILHIRMDKVKKQSVSNDRIHTRCLNVTLEPKKRNTNKLITEFAMDDN